MALILDKTEQKIVDIIDAHRDEIIAFAKDIYTHAELGYKEYRTAEKFASFMKNLGLETKEGLAVTGVKAYLNEEEKTNVSLALIGNWMRSASRNINIPIRRLRSSLLRTSCPAGRCHRCSPGSDQ